MTTPPLHILIADDDDGDRLLFTEALRELPLATLLTAVNGGEQLMDFLGGDIELPHILFLDLNMPRKNGFECLKEIKQSERLKNLPVVIFSTSDEEEGINRVFADGAHLYLIKPPNFLNLIKSIKHVIIMSLQPGFTQLPKASFVVNSTSIV